MGAPQPVVQVGQPLVGVGVPDGGDEQRHFLVAKRDINQGIPVTEHPSGAVGAEDLKKQQGGAKKVQGQQTGGEGDSAPPAQDQGNGEREIGQDQLIHGPQPAISGQ